MCGLCGVFVNADHWSDSSADNGETRAYSRQVKTRLANQVLAHYSLRLTDAGGSLLLRSATGRAALVPHLGALWPAADRLARKPCDPLDPELIAALKHPGTGT
jgi:hypothetical protein